MLVGGGDALGARGEAVADAEGVGLGAAELGDVAAGAIGGLALVAHRAGDLERGSELRVSGADGGGGERLAGPLGLLERAADGAVLAEESRARVVDELEMPADAEVGRHLETSHAG